MTGNLPHHLIVLRIICPNWLFSYVVACSSDSYIMNILGETDTSQPDF